MSGSARSREAGFTGWLLIGSGAVLAAVTAGVDLLKGTGLELGPVQKAGLALGGASMAAGVAALRIPLVRRIAGKLWPFGEDPPARAGQILAFAVWLGVLSGLLEALLYLLRLELGWSWATFHPHSFWMVPLIDAVTLGALAVPLAGFSRLELPHLGSPRFAAFLLLLIAVGAPLWLFVTELRWISVVLLTLGIAFQGSRFLASRRRGTRTWVRRTAIPLAFILVFAAIAPVARQKWSERSALAGIPDPPDRAPNVLLIILDTVRAQNLSLHGYARRTTPFLERLAQRSTVYDRAYAPSTWTLPSHGSFFTGRPPHQQSGNSFSPLDDALPTLAAALADRGYYTTGIVANSDNAYPHTGLDRGFIRYDAHTTAFWEMLQASRVGVLWRWGLKRFGIQLPTRKDADVINQRFLAALDRRGERPFFAFLNYYDAHYPFDRPLPPFESIDGWAGHPVEIVGEMTPYVAGHVDDYDREIAHLDGRLEALFSALDQRLLLDGTLVIVTSDHGEEFLEHGALGHGFNVYNTTLHVPLIVTWPGVVPSGVRIGRPVALQDLPATILELAGMGGQSPFGGRSFLTAAEESAQLDSPVLSEVGVVQDTTPPPWNYRSLVRGDIHYIRNPDASEEIYDLRADPWELTNLNADKSHPRLAEFRAALSSLVGDSTVLRGQPQRERDSAP
jgi:arylsulfatase A-like enzyme